VKFNIKVLGAKAVQQTMTNLAKVNKDYRQPLTLCAFRMERSVAENFRAQGIPGEGISWKPLSKYTIRMREQRTTRRKASRYKDKALLDSGTLRNSYVKLSAEGHLRDINARRLIFGSTLPYAKKQQEGFTNPGGQIEVAAFTRRKTSTKRRSKKIRVTVKAHTRTVKPSRVPARPHLAIKRKRDVRVFNKIFMEWETNALISGGAR